MCGCSEGKSKASINTMIDDELCGNKKIGSSNLGMGHPQHGSEEFRTGAHVKCVPKDVMHFLVAAECFDSEAIMYLHEWAGYDVQVMTTTQPTATFPALVTSKIPKPKKAGRKRAGERAGGGRSGNTTSNAPVAPASSSGAQRPPHDEISSRGKNAFTCDWMHISCTKWLTYLACASYVASVCMRI
jgi:hypothetical protein